MSKDQTHILIADDDQEDLDLIEESLLNAKPDIRLYKVRNGKAVIDYLNEKENDLPALIVLDYSMPEFNGVQVLTVLNDNTRFKEIPVVILSTSNSPVHINACKKNGAREYFVKPNTLTELNVIAQRILAFCN